MNPATRRARKAKLFFMRRAEAAALAGNKGEAVRLLAHALGKWRMQVIAAMVEAA